jgi:hypothetical protein
VILEYFLADILALCTGMRPAVMIDYGGKMPELQERLCQLMKLIQKVLHCTTFLGLLVNSALRLVTA